MTKLKTSLSLGLSVSALAITSLAGIGSATAQENDNADARRLETVTVNATKRQADEFDIPVAIEVFSGAEVEGSGVVTIDDLAVVSASTSIATSGGFLQPYIRGIGSGVIGPGTYASVATYIDGVYQPNNIALTNATLENAESVQVLKGPQGTLYGRNATGGAILITTRAPQPDEALSGYGQIEAGNFSTFRLNGGASVGLGDKAAIGLNFSLNDRDGYVDNLAPGGDLDTEDGYSIGGKLVFQPTDRLSFVGSASYREDERSALAYQQVAQFDNFGALPGLNNPQTLYAGTVLQFIQGGVLAAGGTPADAAAAAGAATPTLLGLAAQIEFPGFGVTAENANSVSGFQNGVVPGEFRAPPLGYFENTSLSLNSTFSLDTFDIVSITSYAEDVNNASSDVLRADPSTLPDLTVLGLPSSFNQGNIGFATGVESEAFTQELYAVSTQGNIDWIVGAYYFEDTGDVNVAGDAFGTSALVASNNYSVESISAYAEATVPLTDVISVTGGARFTDEESTIDDQLFGNPTIPNLGNISLSDDQLTYNAKVTYDNGDFLGYAGVSTGFKSGALNTGNPGAGQVQPEEVTSYEAGFKSMLGDSVRLNGALFHYDFENIQLNVLETSSGIIFLVDGVEADISGAELGLEAQLSDSLDIFINGTYLDTEYNNDAVVVSTGALQPIAGNELALAPELAASFGLNYQQDITSDISMVGRLVGNYNAGYWADQSNTFGTGGDDDDGFFVANASVDLTNGQWTLSGYINNMFDEEYFIGGFSVGGGLSQMADTARPRHYGARLRFDF